MQKFTNKITLVKNSRGVYDLDTSKGCYHGILNNPKGCYNDCYAARYSSKYGFNFNETTLRNFENYKHVSKIINQINKAELPFIRIGVSGDPSENWNHVLNIIEKIKDCDKAIVIITKHWNNLKTKQLLELSKYNVIFNTSISALDAKKHYKNRLLQYKRVGNYCKSVLRIVSCDFNTKNLNGMWLNESQNELFENKNTLDTVLRIYKKNELVLSGLINIKEVKFLGKRCYVSQYNKDTFFGKCSDCVEMCGFNLKL